MANLEFRNVDTNSFEVRVANLDTAYDRNDRYIEWEVGNARYTPDTTISAYATDSSWKTISGLNSSQQYYVVATVYYTSSGVWYDTFYDGFVTMDNPTPVIPEPSNTWFTNVSTSSITFNWSSVSEATDGYDVYFKDGATYQFITNTSGGNLTFNSLSDGTLYYFGVRAVSGSNESSMATDSQKTSSAPTRPSNWNWTSGELSAFNNNGAITTLSYARWNDFVSRVNAFRTYKGLSTISASMSSSNKILTATMFNTVNNAIDVMRNTYISSVLTGDDILGSYFTTLSNALNDIS